MDEEQLRQQEIESRKQLAEAMTRVATAIEDFPNKIKQSIATTFQSMANLPGQAGEVIRTAIPTVPGSVGQVSIESMVVKLSEEQKNDMVNIVYKTIRPQMKEFNKFVKSSLKAMPPNQLKRLTERVMNGDVPKMHQRPGCIYMEVGEGNNYEDFYLKM